MSRPAIGPRPPKRWEASTLAKSYSNSVLIVLTSHKIFDTYQQLTHWIKKHKFVDVSEVLPCDVSVSVQVVSLEGLQNILL
jgi:hypothetical protein